MDTWRDKLTKIYRKRSRGKRDRRWTDRQTERQKKERKSGMEIVRDKETETPKDKYTERTERQKIDRLTGR